MKFTRLIAVVLAAGLVASCCPCRKMSSKGTASFLGSKWKLIEWDSQPVTQNRGEMESYTITFTDGGNVSGVADCNRFSGSFNFTALDNFNKIGINQLATTRMACPDLSKESAYLEALKKVERFDVDGDILILSDPGRLVFEKVVK